MRELNSEELLDKYQYDRAYTKFFVFIITTNDTVNVWLLWKMAAAMYILKIAISKKFILYLEANICTINNLVGATQILLNYITWNWVKSQGTYEIQLTYIKLLSYRIQSRRPVLFVLLSFVRVCPISLSFLNLLLCHTWWMSQNVNQATLFP